MTQGKDRLLERSFSEDPVLIAEARGFQTDQRFIATDIRK